MDAPAAIGNGARAGMTQTALDNLSVLVFEVGGWRCALPLEPLRETLRALPVEPLAGAPAWMLGLALLRGEPVPVVDVAGLLAGGARPSPDEALSPGVDGSSPLKPQAPTRFIVVDVDGRPVALAVTAVVGVRPLPRPALHALPSLLVQAGAQAIDAIATIDRAMLLLLGQTRLLSDDVRSQIDAALAAGTP